VPPLGQRLVEPGGGAQLRGQPGGYRNELAALCPQQVPRIGAGPGQQGQLEQQFGADITGMRHGLAQPALDGPVPLGGDGQPGPRRSQAAVLLILRRDQAEALEPLHGPVHHRLPHVPDHARVAVRRQPGRQGEPVGGFLADQAQHQPLGQRQARPLPSRHHGSSLGTTRPRHGLVHQER
jgi:hypothetical protein